MSWQAFQRTPATVLRWGLAGAFFTACDTGGFEGSATPPQLLARWYQLSSVLPIMRVHSRVQNPPKWPWLYGSAAEQSMRKSLALRYRLLPTVYSLAHHARDHGTPVVRPGVYQFPGDESVANLDDQFTLGATLLAAPVLVENATTRTVVLPVLPGGASWFAFNETLVHPGGQNLSLTGLTLDDFPLFARAGSILPLAPPGVQWAAASTVAGPLEVQVYAGADATFELVEDDGHTTDYATAATAAVRRTELKWTDATSTLEWSCTGGYTGGNTFKKLQVVLFRPGLAAPHKANAIDIGNGGTVHLPSALDRRTKRLKTDDHGQIQNPLQFDVVVYGATSGGVIAAVSAVRQGARSVALLDPGSRIGGMSAGGLSATDKGSAAVIGGMAGDFYKENARHYNDTSGRPEFRLEPHIALQIFHRLVAAANISLFSNAAVTLVTKKAGSAQLESLTTVDGRSFKATVFIEADYEADLLARAGVRCADWLQLHVMWITLYCSCTDSIISAVMRSAGRRQLSTTRA